MQDQNLFNQELLAFLAASPTPFHVVANMREVLSNAGFQHLDEKDRWQLEPGKRYTVTRNASSVIAFIMPAEASFKQGIRLVGAHTDSPCLKLKPNVDRQNQDYWQLGVEVYGGVLLNPWFDRDLSIAGRVTYRDTDGGIQNMLIDFAKPLAVIPSLAIHLDREVNKNRSINAQTHLPPIIGQLTKSDAADFKTLLLSQIKRQNSKSHVDRILDFELSLYDCQPPAIIGADGEFIASARLDNLLSCFIGLHSLIESDTDTCRVLVCNDHEEIGSQSASGAQGPFLRDTLERLVGNDVDLKPLLQRSMMVSADNAHGVHPNFADKHDTEHQPKLNHGPVIKINANQRYASSSETAGLFRHLCERCDVAVQTFVSRSDLACGSTIGPITAGELGIPTVDVGVPQLAMHSIRELAGSEDAFALYRVLIDFYNHMSSQRQYLV